MGYFLILDVGTSNVEALAFSGRRLLGSAEEKQTVLRPQPGWVELDPMQLMRAVYRAVDKVVGALGRPEGVGITSQRSCTVVWYKETGEPLYNTITWQDARTAELVKFYSRKGVLKLGRVLGKVDNIFSKLAGSPKSVMLGGGLAALAYAYPSTLHSSMHLRWILDNVEGARTALERGAALFGTLDSWVAWNLTGEHVTDVTNASATGLLDPLSLEWNKTILKLLDIPAECLPRIVTNDVPAGRVHYLEAPLLVLIAKQQASMYVAGVAKGAAKITCGTGGFIDLNVGGRPAPASKGVHSMVALSTRRATLYLLEGVVTSAGSVVDWLVRIGLLSEHSEVDAALARGAGDVVFVPALDGLGTPFCDPSAKAIFAGITSAATREDLVKGALEGVAAACALAVKHLEAVSRIRIEQLVADGALAQSSGFLQALADFSGKKVVKTKYANNSAYGAYLLCEAASRGLDAVSCWSQPEIVATFEPKDRSKYLSQFYELLREVKH